jgi:BirA family transcriptional regulator, biotin operon repressor / biotin---[acetyl-CoA-carboxylase] ligase
MFEPIELLRFLSDKGFHSGEALARCFGVSRMTVSQAVKRLVAIGIDIDAVPGQGYRLRCPFELLDSQLIRCALSRSTRRFISEIEVVSQIDSTNSHLFRRGLAGAPSGLICLAEHQTAGKGRRGKPWISPFGSNIYLSILWRFDSRIAELSGLSLMAGLAVARLVRSKGVWDVGLKWPNDIIWRDYKLGGILLEMSGEVDGCCYVVIGVGLNVAMPVQYGRSIDQPWVSMAHILSHLTPSRNLLAAGLIDALVQTTRAFECRGLNQLSHQWKVYDATFGKTVQFQSPTNSCVMGIARGIDDMGRLKLQTKCGEQVYSSGEISLRVQN